MKNELNYKIFHRAFSSRIKIAAMLENALEPSLHDFTFIKKAILEFEAITSELGKGDVEDKYRAYNTAVAIFLHLAEWKHAIRNAETDAQRFLNSAKLKASEVDTTLNFAADQQLVVFLEQVKRTNKVVELCAIQDLLKRWNLPLLLFANKQNIKVNKPRLPVTKESSKSLETTVAFLKFDIDGEPAKLWNYLKPETSYDLTIELRVSNWPEDARFLYLTPVTIDRRERDWLPSFRFDKPEGSGPFTLTATGRAVLYFATSWGSRPYEFLYSAEFEHTSNNRDIAIIGHRRLLLEGSDVVSNPLSGFSNVDRHLLSIRNKFRSFLGLHAEDIANAMIVLGGLGNIAAQALREAYFEADMTESAFQEEVTKMLRNRPDIGENLHGHIKAGGGFTDLTFQDIPLELKIKHNKTLFPKDCTKYFDQTAAYAIGLGKRIGVLSVLEASPKSEPMGVVEDDIEIFQHQSGNSSIVIVVVVVRGGFPSPSSYSR